MSSPPAAQAKRALRAELPARLEAIAPARAAHAADLAAQRFLALPEVACARRVLACLSFGSEISTTPVIEALLAAEREVYVPRADPRDRQLHAHRYPCELVTLSFGLRQPPRGAPELDPAAVDATLDAVLVLGLGFDEQGYRLGYGSGYFDRFLAGRSFPAFGFAYEAQILDRLPHEAHDVPMAAVVTEAATRRFKPGVRS
jgi:5-formyltetrahydrofolate cyclo-ligase